MRTLVQKPKVTQQNTSTGTTFSARARFGSSRDVNSSHHLTHAIGCQAKGLVTNISSGLSYDFSRVPVHRERIADSHRAYEPEESLGPVSQSLDAGVPRDAGIPLPAGAPEPEPAPEIVPDPPPRRRLCTINTQTLVSAPDGTADTRRIVGVNEQVRMTCSASATWTATSGSVTPATGTTVTWTAPETGGSAAVRATPKRGRPCSVSMAVLAPNQNILVKQSDRTYTAGLAGSGFVGSGTIIPTNVAFSRIEIREEEVKSEAEGYYDTVLGWDKVTHPRGSWIQVTSNNGIGTDTVGTNPPGTPGPFSEGRFVWPIPQHYRIVGGSGNGTFYSTAFHVQLMTGTDGTEGTAKEGASRGRVP